MDVKALNKCTSLTSLTIADSNTPLTILGTQSNIYGAIGAFGVPALVNAYVGKNVIAEESPKYRNAPVWELFFDDVPGDVNGDGVVTTADVTAIYNYLLIGEDIGSAGDVNGDGAINSADITFIYNIMLQL